MQAQSDIRRVACGAGAWELADYHRECGGIPPLVLPLGESPENFLWPVRGRMVLIIPCGHISETDRALLARALLRDGAYACQFTDTFEWCGKLPADSLYWTNKNPHCVQALRVNLISVLQETL